MTPKVRILVKIIVVTIISMTFLKFFVMIPLDFGFFFSNKSEKINQFDVYSDLIEGSDEVVYDNLIKVVTLPSTSGREELTDVLNLLAEYEPAAIAIDIHLKGEKDVYVDSLLIEAIKRNKNVVLPYFADKKQDTVPLLIKPGEYGTRSGFVDLDHSGELNPVIRSFVPYHVMGSDTMRCIALEALRLVYPEKIEKLDQRKTSKEYINYMRYISSYSSTEMPYFADEFKGKIVIVGVASSDDQHRTSITSKLYGVMIHAYAASTVYMEDYIDSLPYDVMVISTILILGLFCYLQILYAMKYGRFAGFLVRTSTYLFFFIFLILDFLVFNEYSLYVDSASLLLGIIFLPWALDLYNIIEAFCMKIRNKKIKNKKIKHEDC